ncbi:MAG: MFS transporter [Alphaproteobacteria bacterium]|nr:MFS transporter [Alphaproteobacteria bacterium]
MPRLLTRDFLLLTGAHFLSSLGFSSMLLLPLYLAWLGADRGEIGLIMATGSLGGLASRPLAGAALDTLGRKPTLLLGLAFAVFGLLMVAAVQDLGPTTWAMRLIFGIGEGTMFAAYFTFAADLIPESRRTEGIALFGVSGLLPLATPPIAELAGVNAPDLGWFLPMVAGLVAVSALFLLPLPEPPKQERATQSIGDALKALRARPLWSVWLATVIFSGLVGLFFSFSTVVAERRGVPFPTGLWFTYAGGAAAVRVIGARLPDRVGPSNMVVPALALYIIADFIAVSADSSAGFLVAGLLAGLGHGYCFPVLTSQVVSRAPQRYRGSALSMFTALWGACALVLPPLGGAVADAWGDGAMFTLAAGAAVLGILPWVLLEHHLGEISTEPGNTAATHP